MKNKFLKTFFILLLLVFQFIVIVNAHPGRTDSNGGHYDRSTGEYHYHNGESAGKNQNSSNETYTYENFEAPTKNYNSNSSKNSQELKNFIEDLGTVLFYLFLGVVVICGNYLVIKDKIEERKLKKIRKNSNFPEDYTIDLSNIPTFDETLEKLKQERAQRIAEVSNLFKSINDEENKK